MADECYTMVRGSSLRVTGLTSRGSISSPVRYAASTCVAVVRVDEVSEASSNEMMRSEQTDSPRIIFRRPAQTIRHRVDIDFLRVDPGILSLVTGVSTVTNAAGDIVGFDSARTLTLKSFGLEVWTRLGERCPDGARKYGYTVFPHLRGGRLSGMEFANKTVSFRLVGAQSRRLPKWRVGPYDITGPFQRLLQPVGPATSWRNEVTTLPPPAQTDGVVEFYDIIDGGTAAASGPDILDGGTAASAGPWIVSGGGP